MSSHASLSPSHSLAAQPDTDSDLDVYGQKYVPSQESLGGPPRMGISESSTPTFVDHNGVVREPYPAWSAERQIPLSKEEIEDIFLDLTQKLGFQRDSMRNMVCSSPFGSRASFHASRRASLLRFHPSRAARRSVFPPLFRVDGYTQQPAGR